MNVAPDLKILTEALESWKDRWEDTLTAHGESLGSTNAELALATINDIKHISLTGPKDKKADKDTILSKYRSLRYKDLLTGEGAANEKNWGVPRDFFKDSPLHKHIQDMFVETPIRLRLSRMNPGFVLPMHRDYGTQYAVRFILPIRGNEGVIHKFHVKDKVYEYEMENGKCYFLNIGFNHSVHHLGNEERFYLIGSLDGQRDIEHLWKAI